MNLILLLDRSLGVLELVEGREHESTKLRYHVEVNAMSWTPFYLSRERSSGMNCVVWKMMED